MTSDLHDPWLLRTDGLSCRRGGRQVFSGVSLSLRPADLIWVRGPNGSGKSSLLRVLAGLAPAEQGTLQRHSASAHRACVYLGHKNALNDDLSALEALRFLTHLAGTRCDEADLMAALAQVGLQRLSHRRVGLLSQGQRRKLALARLVLHPAAVWLLDEPYDALDHSGTDWLNQTLETHRTNGGAVVLTSHIPLPLPKVQVMDMGLIPLTTA